MAKIAIVNGDDLEGTVHVDSKYVTFSMDGLIDESIWAVHWDGDKGYIQYKEDMPEDITDFSQFQPIVDKFNELTNQ
jgi:hypothetical protein